jgi:hypothetical protein
MSTTARAKVMQEILDMYDHLDEGRQQELADYAQQLIDEQRAAKV